jgi:hypothetical protein
MIYKLSSTVTLADWGLVNKKKLKQTGRWKEAESHPVVNVIELLFLVRNKLERFVPSNIFRLARKARSFLCLVGLWVSSWPYREILYQHEKLGMDKHSSLFCHTASDKDKKKLNNIETKSQPLCRLQDKIS